MSLKLAIIILSKNEEKNIGSAIDSASFADEILVVDSGSTDATQTIAESKGAKFVFHPMGENGFAGQRNFALTQTEAEWVFYLDADERLTEETEAEIREIVENGEKCAYAIKRMNVVFGKLLHYGAHAPDRCLRLFPREAVYWNGRVHEHSKTDLPQKGLNGVMHHYTYENLEAYFRKFNSYTTLAAEKMREENRSPAAWKLWLDPIFTFFKMYVIKQGWRDGWLGLVMSVLAAVYVWVKYLKFNLLVRGVGA